jgi:hypothetical protein
MYYHYRNRYKYSLTKSGLCGTLASSTNVLVQLQEVSQLSINTY